MEIEVVTLFPGMFAGPLDDGVLARARRGGRLSVRIHDLRRFGVGPHRKVDDAPYGGGGGMVLMAEPFFDAVEGIRRSRPRGGRERVVLLSPQGRRLDAEVARGLAEYDRLILLAGRYEGVDERVREGLADEEISIGDFVLTGGELPAMVVIDTVARFLPGVLGGAEAAERDSFCGGVLDYPQYTRPPRLRGRTVPEVLLSGDHGAIERWRRERALEATRDKRPDLPGGADAETTAPAGRERGSR